MKNWWQISASGFTCITTATEPVCGAYSGSPVWRSGVEAHMIFISVNINITKGQNVRQCGVQNVSGC